MIKLVDGAIGSGKTYFVVNEVLKTYFVFDEESLSWKFKDVEEVAIYSNVDSFYLSQSLVDVIKVAGGINPFFTVPYQMEFTRLRRHVYIIDEAQRSDYFHRKFYDQKVFDFFTWVRHVGVDVYLITQDVYNLCRELQTQHEYHINVPRRSYSYAKEFRYHYMVGKDIFRRKVLKKDLRVFMVYRSSYVIGGGHDVESFAKRYYVYIVLFVLITFGGGYTFLKYGLTRHGRSETVARADNVLPGKYKVVAVSGDVVFLREGKKMVKARSSSVVGSVAIGSIVSMKE